MPGVQNIEVTPEEAGQKLVQFLQRRLGKDIPQTAIMRWIRTGQVRVNKGRVKPFDRLAQGDTVRIPPFEADAPNFPSPASGPDTHTLQGAALPTRPAHACEIQSTRHDSPSSALSSITTEGLASYGINIISSAPGLLVLHKPAGLPVQTGTGHDDAITTRLSRAFHGAAFMPTPAHRLDKDTSGLLLVATSYIRLQALHALLRDGHAMQKVYLAWVDGHWPEQAPMVLQDTLAKRDTGSGERVVQVGNETTGEKARDFANNGGSRKANHVQAASCTVYPVLHTTDATLLAISLHTGRTHQIRVQLAGRGYPIIGDRKYGDAVQKNHPNPHGMLLHAWRLGIPQLPASAEDASYSMAAELCMEPSGAKGMPPVDTVAETYVCLPQWENPFAVTEAMLHDVQNILTEDCLRKQHAGLSAKK